MLRTTAELDAQIGAKPASIDLKVIDHLDGHVRRWLRASPLAFASFSDAQSIDATIAGGGVPGVAAALDEKQLRLPRAQPWVGSAPPADIDSVAIFAAHVRLNKARGLGAIVAKGLVAVPGLMRKSLDADYKRNRY